MGMTLFELSPITPASKSETVKDTKGRTVRHKPYAALIGHGPAGFCCATCAFLLRDEHHDKRFFKCGRVPVTRGAGSDIRKGDPACSRYEHGPGRQIYLAAPSRRNGGYERGRYMFSLKAD